MFEFVLWQTAATAVGFALDFVIGDPIWLPHPVMAIGKLISFFDRKLRIGNGDKRDLFRGRATAACVASISVLTPAAVLAGAYMISKYVYFAVECVMCWQLIAARQLSREANGVRKKLEAGDLSAARKALSNIVGRDTDVLDDKGICRAAVETVAENASDGVIAPLTWMLLFGALGGFFYKSVNTMDSMIGYKNEKYLYFGRAAAKTDDFVNFIPSRLCAAFMIAVCPAIGLDAKNALRIFKRDRFKHASPNSAQTESVVAGALGVRLAGDAVYGGKVIKKEYIGDAQREIEPKDIARASRLMYGAALLTLFLILAIRLPVIICF